jgi:hypothetical protein
MHIDVHWEIHLVDRQIKYHADDIPMNLCVLEFVPEGLILCQPNLNAVLQAAVILLITER